MVDVGPRPGTSPSPSSPGTSYLRVLLDTMSIRKVISIRRVYCYNKNTSA